MSCAKYLVLCKLHVAAFFSKSLHVLPAGRRERRSIVVGRAWQRFSAHLGCCPRGSATPGLAFFRHPWLSSCSGILRVLRLLCIWDELSSIYSPVEL